MARHDRGARHGPAKESVTLTAKVSETVRKVAFDSGDIVRAGDVIVDLSSGAQLAGLEEARAAYQEAERQLARGQELAPVQDHLREPARHAARDARCREGAHGRRARAALGSRDHGALRRHPRPAPREPGHARDAGHGDRDARRHLRHQARLHGARALPRRARRGPGHRGAQRDLPGPRVHRQGHQRRFARRPGDALGHGARGAAEPRTAAAPRHAAVACVSTRRARQAIVVPEIAVLQVGTDAFVYRVSQDQTAASGRGSSSARAAAARSRSSPGSRMATRSSPRARSSCATARASPSAAAPAAPRQRGGLTWSCPTSRSGARSSRP